jgi:hypothetical protein
MFRLFLLLVVNLPALPILANENAAPFRPSTSVEETLNQHKRLPDSAQEVCWIPTGEDMRWNNRYLQQLFLTVSVYRNG